MGEKSCKFYGDVMQFVAKHNLPLIKVSNRTGFAIGKAFRAVMNQIVVSKEILSGAAAAVGGGSGGGNMMMSNNSNHHQQVLKKVPPPLVMDR